MKKVVSCFFFFFLLISMQMEASRQLRKSRKRKSGLEQRLERPPKKRKITQDSLAKLQVLKNIFPETLPGAIEVALEKYNQKMESDLENFKQMQSDKEKQHFLMQRQNERGKEQKYFNPTKLQKPNFMQEDQLFLLQQQIERYEEEKRLSSLPYLERIQHEHTKKMQALKSFLQKLDEDSQNLQKELKTLQQKREEMRLKLAEQKTEHMRLRQANLRSRITPIQIIHEEPNHKTGFTPVAPLSSDSSHEGLSPLPGFVVDIPHLDNFSPLDDCSNSPHSPSPNLENESPILFDNYPPNYDGSFLDCLPIDLSIVDFENFPEL